MLNSDIAKYIL